MNGYISPPSEICCLLGPSGSGKTTLIRLMIGAIVGDEGTVQIDDVNTPNLSMLGNIGFMPQNDALYDDLSAEDNLRFFGGLQQMKKETLEVRMNDVLALVDLSTHRKKMVRDFSGGMKKRLSLAASILHSPKILFLDEPTVGIDPELRLSIWNELIRLKKEEGKTIIVTTHVMEEAERCDYIAMVRDGRILTRGTPSELKEAYNASNFDEVFLHAGRAGQ